MSTLIRDALDRRLSHGEIKLPMMPSVVARIMAVVHDPKADIRQLGELVSQDPGLAAR